VTSRSVWKLTPKGQGVTPAETVGCLCVSIHTHHPRDGHELDALLARAGGNLRGEGHRASAVDFGSAAGELAACVSGVGLADRSELVKLVLEGSRTTLDRAIGELTGAALAPGGALRTGETWWCAAGAERILAISEPTAGDRLYPRVRGMASRHPALAISDRSDEWSAIQVVGRRAGEVLAALGVYGPTGDPRSVSPVSRHAIAGVQVTWLLQTDHRALALMDHGEAPAVWQALNRVGRPFGMCAVGREALARYSLLARSHPEL
jgi:glycine cleavage system aminomethyltransferase T